MRSGARGEHRAHLGSGKGERVTHLATSEGMRMAMARLVSDDQGSGDATRPGEAPPGFPVG